MPAALWAGSDSGFPVTFFPKIILHLLRPILVSILLFFFSLPLSLLSSLNLVAGSGRKNKSFCCNEKRVSFISIHKYILLLLFAFLFLSPGHFALIFNSEKSGRQREIHMIIKISA